MEDREIIDLYWQRDQQAIHETSGKYGGFLWNIAWNILRSHGDAEECVNDTYLRTWNAIPPARPTAFRAWLGRITRNLSLDRWKLGRALRRGQGAEVLLGELDECSPPLPDWTARWKTRRLRHPSARSCAAFPGKTGSCSCGDIGTATPLQALHSGWAVEKAK